ncbi:hypothetical protein D3C84_1247070 [compost metagenome]
MQRSGIGDGAVESVGLHVQVDFRLGTVANNLGTQRLQLVGGVAILGGTALHTDAFALELVEIVID